MSASLHHLAGCETKSMHAGCQLSVNLRRNRKWLCAE